MIAVLGDLHYQVSRLGAIKTAEESIIKCFEGRSDITRWVLLGDLFHKKPSANERYMLASFIRRLQYICPDVTFIVGNGKHAYEDEHTHEADWITLCPTFTQYPELKMGSVVFTHSEFKGLRYANGHMSDSTKEALAHLTYVSGHIHDPALSFNNVVYAGSIYKVAFDEINNEKRILLVNTKEGAVDSIPIESRPMYQVFLKGKNGKVAGKGLKEITDTDIDLKIQAETDSLSIAEIHRTMDKIKSKFTVEYYQEDIKIVDVKTDIPENLDQESLLKTYCEKRGTDYALVNGEL